MWPAQNFCYDCYCLSLSMGFRIYGLVCQNICYDMQESFPATKLYATVCTLHKGVVRNYVEMNFIYVLVIYNENFQLIKRQEISDKIYTQKT